MRKFIAELAENAPKEIKPYLLAASEAEGDRGPPWVVLARTLSATMESKIALIRSLFHSEPSPAAQKHLAAALVAAETLLFEIQGASQKEYDKFIADAPKES